MRPLFHFTPPQHWMNDPNGLIYFQGNYHIFYQHFPYASHWGTMHWGHSTTKDFIHFNHHPIALYPSKLYDQNGCFSGSAIYFNNQLHFYYTAIRYKSLNETNIHIRNSEDDTLASQAMITSPDGYHFNPNQDKHVIITEYPQSRDPKAWIGKNNHVYLALGNSLDGVGSVLFYESENGKDFSYKNMYRQENLGDMWECPDIFKLDNQSFLMICPENITQPPKPNCNAIIMPVDFNEDTCCITNVGNYQFLDDGLDFYAPQSFLDENGNRVILAWLRMRQPFKNENWVGMFCMPRILTHKDTHIYQQVHPLIRENFKENNGTIDLHQPFLLKVSLKENDTINLGNFIIEVKDDCLVCDRTQVSINHKKVCNINHSPKLYGQYDLDIYYDYGVFEIFINQGKHVMSQIVYDLDLDIVELPEDRLYQLYLYTENE